MHPAPSIIFFTVFSGLGFGLLTFLGLGTPDVSGFTAAIFFFIAFAMAVGGLIASTFHLGNPQRALKAFSQWRTSWLSREACLSAAALVVMGLYAFCVVFFDVRITLLGLLGSVLCIATVFATSMIYAQIKTVPRWAHWTTPTLFLGYSLGGGGFLAGKAEFGASVMVLTSLFQLFTWYLGDRRFAASGSTIETATGLGKIGKVRIFEAPHSSKNYLLKEMVHQVGRKHRRILRIIGFLCLGLIPYALMELVSFTHVTVLFALLIHLAGLIVIRWLFFAEAEHTVGLYYGQHE